MELDPIKLEQLREKIHSDILKQIWGPRPTTPIFPSISPVFPENMPLSEVWGLLTFQDIPEQTPQSAIEENEPKDANDECIQ